MKKKPKPRIDRAEQILPRLDELNQRCHRLTVLAALLEHCATAPEGQLRPQTIGGAGAMMSEELEELHGELRRLAEGLL